jgi:glycosyltransferase involved in cell wall biosynthesis
VLNDAGGVRAFFLAMARQTILPHEIVLTDAGSTDGTWELINSHATNQTYPIKVVALQQIRCSVAQGRNLAIHNSTSEIIVSTDIGCQWTDLWIEHLTAPLLSNSVDLVIGSWAVDQDSITSQPALIEWCIAGDQTLIADKNAYSSSRSIAYKKNVWLALGEYPEDLSFAGDDAVFHFLIENAEVKRTGCPNLDCYWHRHETLRQFLKEKQRYGRGDGEALIRLKDFLLTAGRLILDVSILPTLLVLNVMHLPILTTIFLLGLISVGLRVHLAVKQAKRHPYNGIKVMLNILRFTYLTKFYWVYGYVSGSVFGFLNCRKCRKRLEDMSPETYNMNLATLKTRAQ